MNFFKDLWYKKSGDKTLHQPLIAADKGYLQGQFLLATPLVQDPYFAHSVIYICSHDDFGAMGLVVNKEIRSPKPQEVLESLKIKASKKIEFPICFGGPLENTRGFVLHSSEYATKGTVAFNNGVAISSDRAVLEDYFSGNGPKDILLAMGYTGWTRGQLEQEIDLGAWISVPANSDLVFNEEIDSRWQKAAQNEGINLFKLAPFTGRA